MVAELFLNRHVQDAEIKINITAISLAFKNDE